MEKKRKDVDPLKDDRKDDFYYENNYKCQIQIDKLTNFVNANA